MLTTNFPVAWSCAVAEEPQARTTVEPYQRTLEPQTETRCSQCIAYGPHGVRKRANSPVGIAGAIPSREAGSIGARRRAG